MKMATGDRHKSTFNKTQQVVLDTILAGHNVVVLGKARTGKTFLLRRIIELLKPSKEIEVTSASGISTLLFESAKTLHSLPIDSNLDNEKRYFQGREK